MANKNDQFFIMENKIIKQIQKRVIALLRNNTNKPLYIASIDTCSEMARLAGCWISKKLPQAKIFILKGKNIQNTKRSHDILAIEFNENIDLIDPTVWQFFKYKKSIHIKNVKKLADVFVEAKKIYGGEWKISEELIAENYECHELKKIIISTINI